MKTLDFGRGALSTWVAAAMLGGCGVLRQAQDDTQPPIAAPGNVSVVNDGSLPYHKTFRYTGSEQSFKVPAGVKKLTVVALGARGAGNGVSGAYGGRVLAVVPVTPGKRLAVFVGGPGAGTLGGFNGGNDGGARPSCNRWCGYGGGGSSDVREGGNKLTDRILVVGGGGGAGGYSYTSRDYGNGGKGGGSAGGSGAGGSGSGSYSGSGGGGGGGGTQESGGSGGYGGRGYYGDGNPGSDGALQRGGIGGAGCHGSSSCREGGLGGGGGGGYYGGGGGGVGGSGYFSYAGGGGGGGGGSSYIERSAIKFRTWTGWKGNTSNGLVVFSWSRPR